VSHEARGCRHGRHGIEGNTGTDLRLLEAQVSTLWMHKSMVAEACVRMLGYRGMVVKSQEPRGRGSGTT
jgi:hypothetical protein